GLFKSADAANSWAPFTNGLAVLNISTISINPNTSSTIYAGTRGVDSFGGTDGFLTKFHDPASLEYSVAFGGRGTDEGWDVAVDGAGNAFVAGSTTSTNFPVTNTG